MATTAYTLFWNGSLITTTVPAEISGEKARWTWAAVRLTGGSIEAAWRAALTVECPGLKWMSEETSSKTIAKSYDACVFGDVPAVVRDADMFLSAGKKPSHIRTHMPPPHRKVPVGKHEASDNEASRKPRTPLSTSNASSHRVHREGVARPQIARPQSKQNARPDKAGWMGRGATNPPLRLAAPHA